MPQFNAVETIRQGDADGNQMVIRLETPQGIRIYAIGVPQDIPSRTGPTWAYLFDNHGFTLIDAGATGSYKSLADGVQAAGFQVQDIERVVITHGHQDHDGAAGLLAEDAAAEIWAHDIYAHLLPFNPWDIQRSASSPIQTEMRRVVDADKAQSNPNPDSDRSAARYAARHKEYFHTRSRFHVARPVRAGETHGGLAFIHSPGHSPDEICATLDGIIFTGDHVLPEITPHPTTKTKYAPAIRSRIPERFHAEDEYFGLEPYLRSLAAIARMGDAAVLPAHRLFSKNRFNLETAARAQEILQHHAIRLTRILNRVGDGPAALEDITRGVFARRKLIGGNLYMALSEIVAHIELLQDIGDLTLDPSARMRRTGSENHRDLISDLTQSAAPDSPQ